MHHLLHTGNYNKFVTIGFEENDANRSKMQAIKEYLRDVADNAKEYFSVLNVTGIFSFEEDCPIENWLYKSVDNLKGYKIELPTNWLDISELTNAEKWPLSYSLSMERIEKERLNIPVEAFRFWEQRDFKELLTEVMTNLCSSNSAQKKKKNKESVTVYWKCLKSEGKSMC